MNSWRLIQKQNFTNWKTLAEYLELKDLSAILPDSKFPLNLPLRLAAKIRKNDLSDPILRQFLPTVWETKETPGFLSDPVGDNASCKSRKLLHKYQGRALLLTTGACAMHCRFCFRRNYDYFTESSYEKELQLITADPSIREIILSGGDPLSLANPALESLIDNLCGIPHLIKLRFHTRFPVGIPERIDPPFLRILEKCRLQTFFVVHCNHPQELGSDLFTALKKIQKIGIPVLNSAVLLKDTNDNVQTLNDLFQTLSDHGVIPYYLNQLDRVQGGAHFEVPEEEGLKIMRELASLLPGYALPRYIREIAGRPSKTIIY